MEQTKFEREVLDRLMRLETKIDMQDYKGIQEKCDSANNLAKTCEERIEKLEDNQKWLVRLILGAIILGILAFVYHV